MYLQAVVKIIKQQYDYVLKYLFLHTYKYLNKSWFYNNTVQNLGLNEWNIYFLLLQKSLIKEYLLIPVFKLYQLYI